MSRMHDVVTAFDDAKREYDKIAAAKCRGDFSIGEVYGNASGEIACADNIRYMAYLLGRDDLKGGFQLIYTDPPFLSGGKYQASFCIDSPLLGRSGRIRQAAYSDYRGSDLHSYLTMLAVRLMMMRDMLSDTGCIVIHLDWHAVHCVRLLLDEIFGEDRFVNEIIWTYKSGGASGRRFARKHDTLLAYSRGDAYKFNPLMEKSYNREMKPYRFRGVEEYEDENGWYTTVNMKDVWSIDMVGRTSGERTGYATQKPEKLLERIVEAFSDEGDLCGDFFAGSGSFGAVCARMNRPWVMCDDNRLAVACQIDRLAASTDGGNAGFAVLRDDAGGAGHRDGSIGFSRDADTISLQSYIPNCEWQDFNESELGEIMRYLREDSLSLIKFWSVDTDYDGRVHRAAYFCADGERSVKIEGRTGEGRVHVQGYDVFGNRFSGEV